MRFCINCPVKMNPSSLFVFLWVAAAAFANLVHGSTKHYVVYMGEHSFPDSDSVIASNHEMLHSVIGSVDEARKAVVHHYARSFRGFSAFLTAEQAKRLSDHEDVVKVFENTRYKLHTTRSWDFMETLESGSAKGLFDNTRRQKNDDVIIGHFDSGFWPESDSFKDDGFDPVPSRFKGECVEGQRFTKENCNRKVIGARYYYNDDDIGSNSILSPRDDFGHGSHTSSTAAGLEVKNVDFGLGELSPIGGAPNARLAIYKTCWNNACSCSNLLKAADDAIADGVDIITASLGGEAGLFNDCLTIASFEAYKKGIIFSASGGNSGDYGTVTNIAPWFITVAASTLDREFYSYVRLGNQTNLKGIGLNYRHYTGGNRPVIFGRDAANYGVYYSQASVCMRNSLNPYYIQGKIVVCESGSVGSQTKAEELKEGGAAGMILIYSGSTSDMFIDFAVPTTLVSNYEASKLWSYLNQERYPVAEFLPNSQELGVKPAPQVTSFSSRGPNQIISDLLKPDITAPGYNILAAYPPFEKEDGDGTRVYRPDSGTSMSCPHISGIVAVIKSVHRDWSSAAIRSAIMTTATTIDNTGNTIRSFGNDATAFDFGAGHVNPDRALDPGLVYDFNFDDVIEFLCAIGESPREIARMSGKSNPCNNEYVAPYNLNYPSITIGNLNQPVTVYRTLTFVGKYTDPKIYKVSSLETPRGVSLWVQPDQLDFSKSKTQSYQIYMVPENRVGYAYGSITWSDGKDHQVRSPITVYI